MIGSRRPAAAALAAALLGLAGTQVHAQTAVPSCFGAAARDPQVPCRNRELRLRVIPAPDVARDELNAPCNAFGREGDISVCGFGVAPEQATRSVALLGDSHASHWRAPLAAVAGQLAWRGLSVTRTSCPYSTATRRTPEPARSSCRRWVAALPQFFAVHPEIDTVFVVALSGDRIVVPRGRTPAGAAMRGYRRAWAALPATVRHIVVIRDTPRMAQRTAGCIRRSVAGREPPGTRCASPRRVALHPDPQATAARRAHSARLQVIDLTRVFCGRRVCFPVIGGALVFKDVHHLSLAFAGTLAAQLQRAIRQVAVSW